MMTNIPEVSIALENCSEVVSERCSTSEPDLVWNQEGIGSNFFRGIIDANHAKQLLINESVAVYESRFIEGTGLELVSLYKE